MKQVIKILVAGFLLVSILSGRADDDLNWSDPLSWSDPVGGLSMAIRFDKSNCRINCWIRNSTDSPIKIDNFPFGYFELVNLEFLENGKWIRSEPLQLIPSLGAYSGVLRGREIVIDPGAVVTDTYERENVKRIILHEHNPNEFRRMTDSLTSTEALTFAIPITNRTFPRRILDQALLFVRVSQTVVNAEKEVKLYSKPYVIQSSQLPLRPNTTLQLTPRS